MASILNLLRRSPDVRVLTFSLSPLRTNCMEIVCDLAERSRLFVLGLTTYGDVYVLFAAEDEAVMRQGAGSRQVKVCELFNRVFVASDASSEITELAEFQAYVARALRQRRSSLEAVSLAA